MDSKNRMDGCVCANGAKVAEIVHPYCPAHVPPEMEEDTEATRRDLAGWMAEAETQRGNDDALAGVVISKRHGKGDIADQWVHMTMREFVALLLGHRIEEA